MSTRAPLWEELRDSHWMVVDHATLQFAVYPTVAGTVAVMFQHQGDAAPHSMTLCPDEIPLLCRQLVRVQELAERLRQLNAEKAAAYVAGDLLARVKGGT